MSVGVVVSRSRLDAHGETGGRGRPGRRARSGCDRSRSPGRSASGLWDRRQSTTGRSFRPPDPPDSCPGRALRSARSEKTNEYTAPPSLLLTTRASGALSRDRSRCALAAAKFLPCGQRLLLLHQGEDPSAEAESHHQRGGHGGGQDAGPTPLPAFGEFVHRSIPVGEEPRRRFGLEISGPDGRDRGRLHRSVGKILGWQRPHLADSGQNGVAQRGRGSGRAGVRRSRRAPRRTPPPRPGTVRTPPR